MNAYAGLLNEQTNNNSYIDFVNCVIILSLRFQTDVIEGGLLYVRTGPNSQLDTPLRNAGQDKPTENSYEQDQV